MNILKIEEVVFNTVNDLGKVFVMFVTDTEGFFLGKNKTVKKGLIEILKK